MEENEKTAASVQGDNLFLTAPFRGRNSFWRYFVVTLTPFIVSNTIGAIPLVVVMLVNSGRSAPQDKGGMPDFNAMGIDLNLGFFLMAFPFVLAFLAFAFTIKPFHERSFISVINGSKRIRWGRIFVSAAVWTILSALYLYFSVKGDPDNFKLLNKSGTLLVLAILSLVLIPFQAGFEEVLYRGYLMQGFAVLARNRWVPLVATSLLFGLSHAINPEVKEYGFLVMIPMYVFMGLVYGIMTLLDDGIEIVVGAHIANNIFLSVFLTHKDSVLQTPSMYEQMNIYPWHEFVWLVIMSLIFLAIMALICRWKDFKKLYARITVSDL